jgi:hypothetical protein
MKLKGFKVADTIRLIIARGVAGGIIWMVLLLILSPPGMDYMVLLYPIFIPLLALALFLAFVILEPFKLNWIPGILAMIISIPGDPILYFLKDKFPYLVPVEKFSFFNIHPYIYIYDTDVIQKDEKQMSEKQKNSNDATMIYNSAFGGSIIGRLEENGLVFTSNFGGNCIGKVDKNGKVYDSCSGGSIIARVENNGKVFSDSFGGEILGTIDSDGGIHSPGLMNDGEIIAKVKGTNIYGAGAAYLALLKK